MDGLGSINDYIEIFEGLEETERTTTVSVRDCASLELVTQRAMAGRDYEAADEVVQRLTIAADGAVSLRANTWHHGPQALGIGRILDIRIPRAAVSEITRLLDTWLFTRDQAWSPAEDAGRWYLRIRQQDGKEQIQRGSLDGAFVMEMDVAQFIRERIPIEGLYLFDQDI